MGSAQYTSCGPPHLGAVARAVSGSAHLLLMPNALNPTPKPIETGRAPNLLLKKREETTSGATLVVRPSHSFLLPSGTISSPLSPSPCSSDSLFRQSPPPRHHRSTPSTPPPPPHPSRCEPLSLSLILPLLESLTRKIYPFP